MPRTLPIVPSIGEYTFGCTLDSVQYLWRVRWNARDNAGAGAWYLDISAQDGTPIAQGLKVALGTNMGRNSSDPFFHNYALTAIDLSNQDKEAGFDDLGTRVVIVVKSITDILYNTNP